VGVNVRVRNGWILSPRADLAVFAGPLVAAAVLAAIVAHGGGLFADLPTWAFLLLVVGCDVAHVYATLFRTYLDPDERRRRPGLLTTIPLAVLAVGVLAYQRSPLTFWRGLAYVAAFHFVRQPWGWMSYAARRAGETSRWDRRLDALSIHAATLYPLVWWHGHLPRRFAWFVDGDFAAGLPSDAVTVALGAHVVLLGAWVARQATLLATGRPVNLAKWLVLGSTWLAWTAGIVWIDSDLVFTATNVLAHGVPYAAVVHRWGRSRFEGERGWAASLFRPRRWLAYLGALVAIAFLEEGIWDRFVWHDHASVFRMPSISLPDDVLAFLVPLLAVPQGTHYVLDAFLWRTRKGNPGLAAALRLDGASGT
jgi:hypothetical protein